MGEQSGTALSVPRDLDDELAWAAEESAAWFDLVTALSADAYAALRLDNPEGDADREPVSVEELVASLATRPGNAWSLGELEAIDPGVLAEPLDRVHYLTALDRLSGALAAMQLRTIAAIAGSASSQAYLSEIHVEHEISVARRSSSYAAGRAIELARALATEFPSFLGALEAGEITQPHCALLVERTRVVSDPEKLAVLERILLPKARRMTPGEFRREVSLAIMRVDAEAAADRHRAAKEARNVTARELEDGMGFLGVVDDWTTINALHQTLSADARSLQLARGGASASIEDPDAALGACRADALAARVLGRVGDDGQVSWEREPVTVMSNLVIDLETLRGEADHPCLLDGQPIPAAIGREMARGAERWRRMVTDPVSGHLLDYGREVYLPEPLRRFVGARDGVCRAPGCTTRHAARLQMDHAAPFPEGASDTANTGTVCTSPHHQLKTAGYADITDSAADGSATWVTAWGQRVAIPPRPFLREPADDVLAAEAAEAARVAAAARAAQGEDAAPTPCDDPTPPDPGGGQSGLASPDPASPDPAGPQPSSPGPATPQPLSPPDPLADDLPPF